MRMVVWATSSGSVIRRSSAVAAARTVFQGDPLRAPPIRICNPGMGFDLREIYGKNLECMGRIVGDTQDDILRNTLKSLLDADSGAWGKSERGISKVECE